MLRSGCQASRPCVVSCVFGICTASNFVSDCCHTVSLLLVLRDCVFEDLRSETTALRDVFASATYLAFFVRSYLGVQGRPRAAARPGYALLVSVPFHWMLGTWA